LIYFTNIDLNNLPNNEPCDNSDYEVIDLSNDEVINVAFIIFPVKVFGVQFFLASISISFSFYALIVPFNSWIIFHVLITGCSHYFVVYSYKKIKKIEWLIR